jgi:hypothetical protein
MSMNRHLPPGCRDADLCHGESRINDLSAGQLWALLDDRLQSNLYRRFFRRHWGELACLLEESAQSDQAIWSFWLTWRDKVVNRMASNGEIRLDDGGRRPC